MVRTLTEGMSEVFAEADRTGDLKAACTVCVRACACARVCERYQENTVRLLNRNNKQTVEVLNKR